MTDQLGCVAVSGPTASGKSTLALRLAEELGAEILSVDSVQVYKGCDIGSAKVSAAEQSQLPHHLIDLCHPDEEMNLARFIDAASVSANAVAANGKLPVVCGGSTLYLKYLFSRLADLPSASPELREELESLTGEELVQRLAGYDPELAKRLHVNDRVRLIRGIETSEIPATEPQTSREAVFDWGLVIVLVWDREELYRRINERASAMLDAGLIDETRLLVERFGEDIKVLKSVGYAECLAFLRGESNREELAETIAQSTRRFAKRQLTFWRNEPKKSGWQCHPNSSVEDEVLRYSFSELASRIRERLSEGISNTCELWFVDGESVLSNE